MILARLHQVANWALERRQYKWQCSNNSETTDIHSLHQECVSTLYHWLDQLESFQCQWPYVRNNLYNLCKLKAHLEEQCWTIPSSCQTQWHLYKHDLLYYLMMNSLIHEACQCFQSFCDSNDYPSAIFLYPKLRISPKRISHLLQSDSKNKSWIKKVLQQPSPTYLIVYNKLNDWHKQLKPSDPILAIIHPLLTKLAHPPNKASVEYVCVRIMEQVLKKAEHYTVNPQWPTMREILAAAIRLEPDLWLSIDDYLHWYENNHPEQILLKEEIDFWEQQIAHQSLQYPHTSDPCTSYFYQSIVKTLKEKEKASLQDQNGEFHQVKAVFNESPETFARIFHRAISRGMFSVNKSADTKTVLSFLISHFTVFKKNGCGEVSFNTLHTYFKRMNSGDM